MDGKFNTSYLVKGVVYALILALGIAIGAIMKSMDLNFYLIWAVVSFINIGATILVFKMLKTDLIGKEEENEPKKTVSKEIPNKGKND